MRFRGTRGTRTRRALFRSLVNLAGLAAIYAVLLAFLKPSLLLTLTSTSGGDTGAHIAWAWYLKRDFLPHFRLSGWTQDWYAGFPLFQFYFVVPYLLIALLSFLIPYQIAFKLGTVLGSFLLPVCVYAAMKLMRFEFPMPILAAVMTLPFLFMESYSIYGANILSTLAGEFTYSVSFSLSILFLGLLYRAVEDRRFILSAAVVLALVALDHLLPVIFILLAIPFFLLRRKDRLRTLGLIAFVGALAFGLSAFWSIPFLAKLQYSVQMEWGQLHGLDVLFPQSYWAILVLAALGVASAIRRRDPRTDYLLWLIAIPVLLFFLLPDGRVWNGRFLPFFYFFAAMFAAYAIFSARHVLSYAANKLLRLPQRHSDYLVAVVATALVVFAVARGAILVPAWIEWNYTGYEAKPAWNTFRSINSSLASLPKGRVMWENSPTMNKFGTPEALMMIPYFSGQPTMESILIESAFTAPFHFVMQSELSEQASGAVQGVHYPPFDMAAGVRHMRLFNVRYYIALTTKATKAADSSDGLRLLKRIDEFSVYEVRDPGGYVIVLKNQPQKVKTSDWTTVALKWFGRPGSLDTPLVLDPRARSGSIAAWPSVSPALDTHPTVPTASNDQHISVNDVSNVRMTNDEISFDTAAIGKPHWVKVSYFPNWRAEGADGPYLASPSLMIVVPRQSHVRLYYADTFSDELGYGVSAASLIALLALAGVGVVRRRTRALLPADEEHRDLVAGGLREPEVAAGIEGETGGHA